MSAASVAPLLDRVAARLAKALALPGEEILPPAGRPGPAMPLPRYIDHTLLKPEATAADVARLCAEARGYGFRAVCVNPCWVSLAAAELAGSETVVATVSGFPLGASAAGIKALEAERAVSDGAAEIDVVIAVGPLLSGDYAAVLEELREVRRAAAGAVLKVIVEACLLGEEDKAAAAMLVRLAGADYVKTSTGFNKSGATVDDVALLRAAVGWSTGVKAAGGIRDRAAAEAMIRAGATRIGTSAGPAIISGGGTAGAAY